MILNIKTLLWIVYLSILSAILIGCGDSGNPTIDDEQVINDPSESSFDLEQTIDSEQDPSACAILLNTNITVPTQLINTSSECDYLLDRSITISSVLTIEPGVVIRATASTRIQVNGGEIIAIGEEHNRIVFEGLVPDQGFWIGIDINRGRRAVFDFVDIRDAGQDCLIVSCPDIALNVSNIALSFTNSSVSNSFVDGMRIGGNVDLQSFSNNQYFGNVLFGLTVDHAHIPLLDVNSDYLGIDEPNTTPGIAIIVAGEQTAGEVVVWKNLNAPYVIDSFFTVSGGVLQLSPGVVLAFGRDAWMTVEGNGVFQALGTAEEPVIIRGFVAEPGFWDGIRFNDTFRTINGNILQFTVVAHSGSTENLLATFGGLGLRDSRVTVSNSAFVDNDFWGIACDDIFGSSVIEDGGGNEFLNNRSGGFDPDCSVRRF